MLGFSIFLVFLGALFFAFQTIKNEILMALPAVRRNLRLRRKIKNEQAKRSGQGVE